MPDSPTGQQDNFETHQTRRDFIKNVLVKTAYAGPIVATFSVSDANAQSSNDSNRKISKVSRPPQPSRGGGIKYD